MVKKIKKSKWLIIMALPTVVMLILFSYIPMFGIVLAFKKWDFIKGFNSEWCGLDNFRLLVVSGNRFIRMTWNTIKYFLLFTLFGTIFKVSIAIAIDEFKRKKLAQFLQSCMILPTFITYIAVSIIVYAVLEKNGIANQLLQRFGNKPIDWYMTPGPWPIILLVIWIWKNAGYGSVLYLSSLSGIDTQLYEAARIDGANSFQRIRFITLPHLASMVVVLTLLSLGGIMHSDTGLFYQVTFNTPLLYKKTEVLDSYILCAITDSADFGITMAVNFYQSVVGFFMIIIVNLMVRRFSPENAIL